jgi:hypothetical protein
MSTDKTFDDVAEAQGWDVRSREIVMQGFIASHPHGGDLVAYAQSRADEENETTALPNLQMDLEGKYNGGQYWNPAEYRVQMAVEDDVEKPVVLWVEDTAGNRVGQAWFGPEEIDGIICMASTDHTLSGYSDDWKLPDGLDRQISWVLQTDMDHEVVLDESQIDEIAAWLRFATGEETWDGGEDWEY